MYDLALLTSHAPVQSDMETHEITIGALLREVTVARPDAEALVEVRQDGSTGRRWTYAELLADSERLAMALSTRFAPGERVVIWSPNSPEWVLMEYACALSGLVLVTANPAFQARELAYVLEQSGAVALFLVEEFRGNPMGRIGAEVSANISTVREVTDMESTALYAQGARPPAVPDVAPTDAAMIQYTSGTTGFPKGAVLSHRGLVNNARFYARRCGVTEATTWINIMPMFHTSGCGMVTLGCLQAGCRMVLVSLFDPDVVLDQLEASSADIILGVPTMVVALLDTQEGRPRDLAALKLVSCGGSMVAPELVRRVQNLMGAGFSTLYGQTEHCPVITQHHLSDSIDDICNTAGQPVAQTEVSIRSVDDNSVVAVGEVGEICACGPCVMLEYNDNPKATSETVDAMGWLHTGDLGRMDARGYVTVTGRVKEMIIRGGENHFPAEIENCLLEHAQVAEVAVVGLPDPKWGEVIGAFIRGTGPLEKGALHAHCRANMSPQKTPNVWVQVESFPLTGSGKIQKFVLRDRFVAGEYSEL
ncbi:class I adenylate-forming enzyme family protein [Ruegeria atlantica]|uniref:Short-chain-fatty-acid--CoA ligase n=1 Tax=Ruegeria atlantica TaxID=81569 RepID=A0A0P1EG90_9RHOB|nr:AMP-binding protein [Ruegeria atlantica]CUH48784.1 Short-chain-fatty-acid--CoA ligase [Ruegeria atlantica]